MRRRPRLLAGLSAFAFALGIVVLLQQFAVRPLTAGLLVAVPTITALVSVAAVVGIERSRR